ncbi:MAG: sulfatase [Verrucomicrobiota bacterium]
MKLKHNSILLGAIGLVIAALPLGAADAAPSKPNVLFIVVDDLRPELGCYGRDYIKSPNIDRLAQAGMVFNRAYCQQAVCSPSRSSLMTGTRPDTTKVWDLVTHFRDALPDVVTLGQCFKENNFFVQGMGKIYHGGLDDSRTWSVPWQNPKAPVYALPEDAALVGENVEPVDQDGPDNKGAAPGSYSVPKTNAPATSTAGGDSTGKKPKKKGKGKKAADGTQGTADRSKANSRGPIYECADVPDNTFEDGKVADLAVKTLGEISKKPQPFFLAVGFRKPHLPWVAPKKYWDLYDPARIALAPNPYLPIDAPSYAVLPNDGEVRAYKGVPPKGHIPDELARKLKQAYFAGVSYTDAQVGRVLAELDRLGLRTNTIVVLWGDHGWKLGEHDAWGKHSNVENDVNAPLIFSAPGMKNAGTRTDALVEFVDIYPTLCDLAGLPLPGHLEGSSLKPLLDDPKRPWKSAAFSQYPRPGGKTGSGPLMGYTMRTDRYRFTVWADRNDHTKVDATELYDHFTDPQENTNLAKHAGQAVTVEHLMAQWRKGWQGAKPPAAATANPK